MKLKKLKNTKIQSDKYWIRISLDNCLHRTLCYKNKGNIFSECNGNYVYTDRQYTPILEINSGTKNVKNLTKYLK